MSLDRRLPPVLVVALSRLHEDCSAIAQTTRVNHYRRAFFLQKDILAGGEVESGSLLGSQLKTPCVPALGSGASARLSSSFSSSGCPEHRSELSLRA